MLQFHYGISVPYPLEEDQPGLHLFPDFNQNRELFIIAALERTIWDESGSLFYRGPCVIKNHILLPFPEESPDQVPVLSNNDHFLLDLSFISDLDSSRGLFWTGGAREGASGTGFVFTVLLRDGNSLLFFRDTVAKNGQGGGSILQEMGLALSHQLLHLS